MTSTASTPAPGGASWAVPQPEMLDAVLPGRTGRVPSRSSPALNLG
ncbi:hypothetical protein OG897_09435 [Streptomyces sp. NBC_00237]|nr:hypothetical protein [Streptomyces sp. NBC_00237]MCX5201671.1 hypothetical protein [Streptomyces sp. NBC_00237]